MEIMPNSTIKFLRNIPFDNDYNDTLYFENPNHQYNFFAGVNGFNTKFVKYTIDKNYYARHSANVIDVELPDPDTGEDPSTGVRYSASTTESLYDCNYMMFCNESFKRVTDEGYALSKWFYAFITDIEYVNNQVARVTFEIDVMQTWMFDYDLEQCFIMREHEETDNIGDNIIPENLDLGYETVCVRRKEIDIDTEGIVIVASKQPNGALPTAVYTPPAPPHTLCVLRYDLSTAQGQTDFLAQYNNYLRKTNNLDPSDVLSMYFCPNFINNDNSFQTNLLLPEDSESLRIPRPADVDGYTPKNKKLLTYPFCFVVLSNRQGINMTYKFEYFDQIDETVLHYANFALGGESLYVPSVCMFPLCYRAVDKFPNFTTDITAGIEYGVALSDFPQLAAQNDAYISWYAQHATAFKLSTATSMVGGMMDLTSGVAKMALGGGGSSEASSGAKQLINTTASAVSKLIDTRNMPPSINGLSSNSCLMLSAGAFGYTLMVKTVNKQQARIIDDYFSMFGYASHKVKVPNTHVRKSWTYTQTVGCTVKGRLPSKYQRQICGIYDKGIRFWVAGKEVGDYTQDNSCL